MNEEKKQLSPLSILECPFEDDDENDDSIISVSHQNGKFINILFAYVEQVDIHYYKTNVNL